MGTECYKYKWGGGSQLLRTSLLIVKIQCLDIPIFFHKHRIEKNTNFYAFINMYYLKASKIV